MFAKLLKHEWKSVSKTYGLGCLIALGTSLVGGILLWTASGGEVYENADALFNTVFTLLGAIIIGLTGALICGVWGLYLRFFKTKFTDQGYLTFTLPASTHDILLSSILNIVIWMAIISITAILCSLLLLVPTIVDQIEMLKSSGFDISQNVYQEIYGVEYTLTFQDVFIFLSESAYNLVLPLVSITIGALVAKKHKILCAVGVGYGLSIVLSMVIGFLSAYILAVGNIDDLNSLYISSAIFQLALAIGGYFLMHHLIEKKLNI